jgi:ABC-type nitrate/sulfonate/bicarbonate transport system substrate-binding protein
MNCKARGKRFFVQWGSILAALVVSVAMAAPSFSSTSLTRKKQLSMTDITFIGPPSQTFAAVWIAQARGFFRSLGISSVTNLQTTQASQQSLAEMLSGNAQFLLSIVSTPLIAIQQGAPLRVVAMPQLSSSSGLAISTAFAQAHNIPSANSTAKEVLAQVRALKGTHITVATSSISAQIAEWVDQILSQLGLSEGAGKPDDDLNWILTGSTTASVTALDAGKATGLASTLPTIDQPNTIIVPLWKLPEFQKSAGIYLSTTTPMIQQHSDTVQAVVTALTEGSLYAISHAKQAEAIVAQGLSQDGFTDPGEQQTLFQQGWRQFLPPDAFLYPDKSSYNRGVQITNAVPTVVLTLPWAGAVVTKFSVTALHEAKSA